MATTNASRKASVLNEEYFFESYGVVVKLESNSSELLAIAKSAAETALVNHIIQTTNRKALETFGFEERPDGSCGFYQNGDEMSERSIQDTLPFFDSMLRISVGRRSNQVVFIHAGVVGWKGRAIVVPGKSFSGKTTLVAELVKLGAAYYSDEYAILDVAGQVHPYARPLAYRNKDGSKVKMIPADDLAGSIGDEGIPVGLVVITEFKKGTKWNPETLSIGEGVVEMVPHTLPMTENPEFSLDVLRKTLAGSVIVRGPRGGANNFAKFLLEYVDTKRE
ncbi:MAG: hypothetical protein WBD22_15760 [Pyrinomonadaceae bacterium]